MSGKRGEWSTIGVKVGVCVCEGECMGRSPGVDPLTLTKYHSCGLPKRYEALER